jgi:acetyl esterase/lipase
MPMIWLPRVAALLSFVLAGLTTLRPRTGWGRLVLFVPKLFAGTHIVRSGAWGLGAAVAGWLLARDARTAVPGLGAAAIASRHVYRIARRSRNVRQALARMLAPRIGGLPARRPEPMWRRDVAIGPLPGGGDPLLADLWQPADPAHRSGLGLVYLHGSGWHYADKDFGTRPFFRHLAGRGHVILDVAYTLAPRADLFHMVADVKRAIGWMKTHAPELGIRADRIILCGGSAGGHLALLSAYTPNHPRLDPPDIQGDTSVRAVISYYGPTDLRAQFDRFAELPGLTGGTRLERAVMGILAARFGFAVIPVHRLLPGLLGGTPVQVPELYDLGSPIRHVGGHCPPTLLLQGMHDFSGAAPQARELHGALRRSGCACFLLELPDTEHGFDLYRPHCSPAARAATAVTDQFLEALR